MARPIILASASPFRRQLMTNAGMNFEWKESEIDERAIEQAAALSDPAAIALLLATEKARTVSRRHVDALVIGCDQTMSLENEVLHKSASTEEARQTLKHLAGRSHRLNSAIVIAINGQPVWDHVGVAELTMRRFSDSFLDRYMEIAGEAVLRSVGAYQLEGIGIQLFERIDGDYFTIIGLPLLPLLQQLRQMGEMDE
ncbi:Maf family nucleotide pyrophosphatase [Pseudomonas sp. R2.Fl]|nr:Maf family nucleotide pyrophosphatase [Pseudomonas sp. R2.Fl]